MKKKLRYPMDYPASYSRMQRESVSLRQISFIWILAIKMHHWSDFIPMSCRMELWKAMEENAQSPRNMCSCVTSRSDSGRKCQIIDQKGFCGREFIAQFFKPINISPHLFIISIIYIVYTSVVFSIWR